jgi:hypothetical protein
MLNANILFYIFSILIIISAFMVIVSNHPVFSLLFLVNCFLFSAFLLFLLECEFLALLCIFVYVGAVAILFLFAVIMLKLKLVNLSFSNDLLNSNLLYYGITAADFCFTQSNEDLLILSQLAQCACGFPEIYQYLWLTHNHWDSTYEILDILPFVIDCQRVMGLGIVYIPDYTETFNFLLAIEAQNLDQEVWHDIFWRLWAEKQAEGLHVYYKASWSASSMRGER